MSVTHTAQQVLQCIGGTRNVLSNDLCMTRLRLRVANPTLIDRRGLNQVPGVLGTAGRGSNGIEVVFGPNTVVDVYEEFSRLTGIKGKIYDSFVAWDGGSKQQKTDGAAAASQADPEAGTPQEDLELASDNKDAAAEEDLEELLAQTLGADSTDEPADEDDVLEEESELSEGPENSQPSQPADHAMRLLVLNGPNINMLGIREPVIYGREDFSALLYTCKTAAKEAGFIDCFCYQSNHEGDLVDKIQDAYQVFDGIVINPGAYTHTSVAILDALKAVSIPAIEVHISDIKSREDFRQISYVRAACFETISGMGIEGYRKAIFDMADHLGMSY